MLPVAGFSRLLISREPLSKYCYHSANTIMFINQLSLISLMKAKNFIIASLVLAVLILAGCAQYSQQTPQQQPTTATEGAATVTIQGFAFNPATLTVKAGTTVKWTNEDSAPHKIASNSFNSENLNKGDSFEFTFENAGTYAYSCRIHPSMKGEIIVQ